VDLGGQRLRSQPAAGLGDPGVQAGRGGRAACGRGRGLRGAAAALGGGAEFRLAGPEPALEQGLRALPGGERNVDPNSYAEIDATPLVLITISRAARLLQTPSEVRTTNACDPSSRQYRKYPSRISPMA